MSKNDNIEFDEDGDEPNSDDGSTWEDITQNEKKNSNTDDEKYILAQSDT